MPKNITQLISKNTRLLFLILCLFFLGFILLPWQPNEGQIKKLAQEVSRGSALPLRLNYQSYSGKIPIEHFEFILSQNHSTYKANLKIHPLDLLKIFPHDAAPTNLESLIDDKTFLPFYFIKNSRERFDYHHERRSVTINGHDYDIEEDTRDFLSIFVWLMKQDYLNQDIIKSTVNINSRVFLVVGKVQERHQLSFNSKKTQLIKLKVKGIEVNQGYRIQGVHSMEIFLVKDGSWSIPIFCVIEFNKQKICLRLVNSHR